MNPVLFLIPVALLLLSVAIAVMMVRRGCAPKRAMAVHFLSLIVIIAVCFMLPLGAAAAPADDAAAQSEQSADAPLSAAEASAKGMGYIGAALAVGLAGIGGGIAVAAGAPAAIGATAEDPKSFGKSIIFVALGEGFGLYGLLVAIMILIL